jgi:hypothetical protein
VPPHVAEAPAASRPQIVQDWSRKRWRFVPTSGPWPNLVGYWFAALRRRRLGCGAFAGVQEPEQAIRRSIEADNADPKPFLRTKAAESILASPARFGERTLHPYHSALCPLGR